MTSLIFKLNDNGINLSCVYVSKDQYNPYRLYKHTVTIDNEHGWTVKHRKQIAKYADLTSVMYYVYAYTLKHEHGNSVPGFENL